MVGTDSVLFVDPKIIKETSYVGGCGGSRDKIMNHYGLVFKGGVLSGDWDKTGVGVRDTFTYRDYSAFKNNEDCIYDWKSLYDSIKKDGYLIDTGEKHRFVEVGLGRSGDLYLADGRHRLMCAQELNVKEIPVTFHPCDVIADATLPLPQPTSNNLLPTPGCGLRAAQHPADEVREVEYNRGYCCALHFRRHSLKYLVLSRFRLV